MNIIDKVLQVMNATLITKPLKKMMPQQLRNEAYVYYTPLSVPELKSSIQELFDKTKGFNFAVNLMGSFTSECGFEVTPKWQFMIIRNSGDSRAATIRGTITKDDIQRTQVNFTVKPNTIFTLFFFIGPVAGLIGLCSVLSSGNFKGTALIGLAFPFLMSPFMLVAAHTAKKNLRERFVKAFDLKPVTQISA